MPRNGNRKRKQAIRALMAETGMNYTRAMRSIDAQHSTDAEGVNLGKASPVEHPDDRPDERAG